MRIRGSKKVHYDAGPNMTPLVDVVMVILIFLMLAGSFGGVERYLTSNVPIKQSGVGQAAVDNTVPDTPLEIRVDRNRADPSKFDVRAGRIAMTIDASTQESWLQQMDQLTEALKQMHQELNAAGTSDDKIQVEIHPQKDVPYAHAIHVFEAVTDAQFKKISFAQSHE
ncbi:MAG: biopolymer transporter ExbD [Phycisphaerales bacterium]|nr:biopolymer transporter ExbD [Phycisphaerales bacterium]